MDNSLVDPRIYLALRFAAWPAHLRIRNGLVRRPFTHLSDFSAVLYRVSVQSRYCRGDGVVTVVKPVRIRVESTAGFGTNPATPRLAIELEAQLDPGVNLVHYPDTLRLVARLVLD